MKNLILLALLLLMSQTSFSKYPTSQELRQKFPSIDTGSERKENKEILCPFWRMIERSGALDLINQSQTKQILIKISDITKKAQEFGCHWFKCSNVARLVSTGQFSNSGVTEAFHVNLTKLHMASGVAHECGLTFKKHGKTVSDEQRSSTLNRLKELSRSGKLYLEDLMRVKNEICLSQNVESTFPGRVEVELIFNYLGGKDRGFIEYSDVERFLNAFMPLTKTIDSV